MSAPEKSSKIALGVNSGIPYPRLRSLLIARGTNLKRWATDHGFPVGSVYHAARGTRAGVQTIKIRNRLLAYVRH